MTNDGCADGGMKQTEVDLEIVAKQVLEVIVLSSARDGDVGGGVVVGGVGVKGRKIRSDRNRHLATVGHHDGSMADDALDCAKRQSERNLV